MNNTQSNNAPVIDNGNNTTDLLTIAKQDAINPNEVKQPIFIPSYGGKKTPVSIVFSQAYLKPDTEKVYIEKDVYELDASGNILTEDVLREGIFIDGKPCFDKVPVVKETKVVATRYKTGGQSKVEFSKTVCFECSDGSDLRKKIGEGFEEFKADCKEGKKIGAKSKPYHLTVKIGGFVISTMSLQEGGAKLSQAYEKGEFKPDLFSRHFCKALWLQLGKVKNLAEGKPLVVSEDITNVLK
jgi:hypothetical protein